MSETPPLIFTPELMARVRPNRRHTAPLIERWAGAEGLFAERRRTQLERIAALVPTAQRERVLGPLTSQRSDDDQVRDAVGGLLLAAALSSIGWTVEYEPAVAKKTPDFRIKRADCSYIVELRRVSGMLGEGRPEHAIARLREALHDLPFTRTPAWIHHAAIDGQASLKEFRKKFCAALKTASTDVQTIAYDGVAVTFEFEEPRDIESPAISGSQFQIAMGSEADLVSAALNEKLGRYKVPIIVALDLRSMGHGFDTVRESLFGTSVISIPVALETGERRGPTTVVRKNDSIFSGGSHEALRARERLVAVLPLEWGSHEGLQLQTQLIANPLAHQPHGFAEFDPIPRLVVTQDNVDSRELRFRPRQAAKTFDNEGEPVWSYTP